MTGPVSRESSHFVQFSERCVAPLRLFATALIILLATGLAPSPVGAQTGAAQRDVAQQRARLDLRNSGNVSVTVEVRIASDADCESGETLGTRELQPGAIWRVETTRTVCWRRGASEQQARPSWQSRTVATGRQESVAVQP